MGSREFKAHVSAFIAIFFVLLLAGVVSPLHSADHTQPDNPLPAYKVDQSTAAAPVHQITLSPEEKSYLAQLGTITICPDPDWRPYEYVDSQGNFTGIAADLLELIANRLGIKFTYIQAKDWDEAVALSQAGKVLLLPFLNQTPKREEWLNFTEPMFYDPNVYITRREHQFISDAALLMNETIAVPNGTSVEERVRRNFPNLKILHTANSEKETFKAVMEHRADLTLRSLTVAAYTIRKEGLFNLKIAGQAPDEYINRLRIGVLKAEPKLLDILNKGIATITPIEREQIVNRHVNITVVKPMDYGLLFRVAAALTTLVGLSFYWNLRLKRSNAALQESERAKSVLVDKLEHSLSAERDARTAQERFIAMISHEYRTPLAIIRGNIDIITLKETGETGKYDMELHKMKRAVNRLVEVMDISLEQSRIADSQGNEKSQVIQVSLFIASVLEYVRALWSEHPFIFCGCDTSKTINGEPEHLKTALVNLLDNARKYAIPDTPIIVNCQIEQNELVVSIHNQCSGITQAEEEQLFEKFRRGRSSNNTSGVGIGLWLVREIMTQHGGSVTLKGTESGVLATVRLPLARDCIVRNNQK